MKTTFIIFVLTVLVSMFVRIFIDRRRVKQEKSQIGWIFGFIIFFALNSILFYFEKTVEATKAPTAIGVAEWAIILIPPTFLLIFFLKRFAKTRQLKK